MKKLYITPTMTYQRSQITHALLEINPNMYGGSKEGRGRNSFANERGDSEMNFATGSDEGSSSGSGFGSSSPWGDLW